MLRNLELDVLRSAVIYVNSGIQSASNFVINNLHFSILLGWILILLNHLEQTLCRYSITEKCSLLPFRTLFPLLCRFGNWTSSCKGQFPLRTAPHATQRSPRLNKHFLLSTTISTISGVVSGRCRAIDLILNQSFASTIVLLFAVCFMQWNHLVSTCAFVTSGYACRQNYLHATWHCLVLFATRHAKEVCLIGWRLINKRLFRPSELLCLLII